MKHTYTYEEITKLVSRLKRLAEQGDDQARDDLVCLTGYVEQAVNILDTKRKETRS